MSKTRFDLDVSVAAWRRTLEHDLALTSDDLEELVQHLYDQVAAFAAEGLGEEEAFRRAMTLMGDYATAEREYRKVYWGKLRREQVLLPHLYSEGSMLKNYAKMAFRTLRRQRVYTLINVVGLGLALAAFLVIARYVSFEFSFDRFHEGADRIYRIEHDTYRAGVLEARNATTFAGLAGAMAESVPEVESATSFYPAEGTVAQGAVVFNEKRILFADAAFFQVFSFDLQEGSPRTALDEPNAVVLTASAARKYFGEVDPIGKTLHVRQNVSGLDATARVTGVVEDPPAASHLQFDLLFSMRTWYHPERWSDATNWKGTDVYTYVSLRPDAVPEVVTARLPALVRRYAGGNLARTDEAVELSLQPITDIRLSSHLQGELGVTGTGDTVWTLVGVGLFISTWLV